MGNGLIRSSKNPYVEMMLQCPRCKTAQKIHIAARAGLRFTGSERISCINCDNRFEVTISDKIVGGPFPA